VSGRLIRSLALTLVAVVPPAWGSPADAVQRPKPVAGCSCEGAGPSGPNVLWRGPSSKRLSAADVAKLAAPIVWFSSDEPILTMGGNLPPDPHPCDAPSAVPVVYWALDRVALRGDKPLAEPIETNPALLEKASEIVIRYFFYYRVDIGTGGHPHDIESADIYFSLKEQSGCREVQATRVVAFAHGVDWYSNELQLGSDTRFPLTFLVEEGKHATAPDRNADGVYTPGYDVNRRIKDAWGVRDVLGSGALISPRYETSMTKPRHPHDRVVPESPPSSCLDEHHRSIEEGAEVLARYELRQSRHVPICPGIVDEKELEGSMRLNAFGLGRAPTQRSFPVVESALLQPPSATTALVPSVAYRWDQGSGVALILRGLDLRELYVVPRIIWVAGPKLSFEALVTQTAAQFASGYFSTGAARERASDGTTGWHYVLETGVKLRVTLSGWQRIFSLGYHFAGVRMGVRSNGFDHLTNLRFVFEVGAGAF
jgi:hypothetical protein